VTTAHRVGWHLVFEDSDHQVLQWALRPNFGHVFAVQEYRGIWQVFNPSQSYWQVLAFEKDEAALGDIIGLGQSVYIERDILPARTRVPWLVGFETCVSAIKGLIGLRAPWIVTPYQLWRWANEEAESARPHGRGEESAA
jgi:hypothetical protein